MNLAAIQPGSPAYAEIERAIYEGRKVSIAPTDLDGNHYSRVCVKVGEDVWSAPLSVEPRPTEQAKACRACCASPWTGPEPC